MRSFRELMNLEGRVALVTGGAGHIGRAFGETLSELGASVVLLDRDEGALNEAAKNIPRSLKLVVDLENAAQVRSVPEAVQKDAGRLDVLINCAGLVGTTPLKGWCVPLPEQSLETWQRAMQVNLSSPFALIQSCLPLLESSGHGSIINILSIYGLVGPDLRVYGDTRMGNPAAYAASKGGLLQLTRYLATVLAPKVRVNAITPGGVERGQKEEFQRNYAERTPLRRMATEEDLKGAIGYLASDLSAYVTGQNLVIDGGWTAW